MGNVSSVSNGPAGNPSDLSPQPGVKLTSPLEEELRFWGQV